MFIEEKIKEGERLIEDLIKDKSSDDTSKIIWYLKGYIRALKTMNR